MLKALLKLHSQKKPDTKILISKFFFKTDVIPPKTESSAAIIAIAKYPEYEYEIVGKFIPNITPKTEQNNNS